MMFTVELVDKTDSTEIAVFRGEFCVSDFIYQLVMNFSVILESLNGDELHAPFHSLFLQLGRAHHSSVITHYLTAQTTFFKPCKAHKINSCFGVPFTFENAVSFGSQRKHMTWAAEILRLCVIINAHTGGESTFSGGNSRSSINMVDRDCESGAVIVGIVVYHLRKMEFIAEINAHRHTDKTFCMSRHEINIFSSGKLSGTYHIAFIFSVLVISNKDDLSISECLHSFLNGIVFKHITPP